MIRINGNTWINPKLISAIMIKPFFKTNRFGLTPSDVYTIDIRCDGCDYHYKTGKYDDCIKEREALITKIEGV